MTASTATTPPRLGRWLTWGALAVALTPVLVAMIRAWLNGTIMLGDAAYFVTRSRDVLTDHHPLVGALSSGSTVANVLVNNLGPLQFDLLAPFTKIDAYWGATLGAGLINIGAIVGVWFSARRMFSTAGVVGAMLATLALEATMGGALLVDTRQQTALLLPFWCLLWLVAALSIGGLWALPWTALVASLLLQTHFSYVYQTALLVVCGLAGAVLATRGGLVRYTEWRRQGLVTGGVIAVCWVQTLWDQLFGTGNLRNVLGASESHGLGLRDGTRVIADSVLLPPFWAPGGIEHYLRPSPGTTRLDISTWSAVLGVVAWTAALVAVVVIARRRHRPAVTGLGVVSLVALLSGLIAAVQLPSHPTFGMLPQNYYWMWPIGVFATAAAGAGALVILKPRIAGIANARSLAMLAAIVLVAVAIPASRDSDYWPQSKFTQQMAKELRRELRRTLPNVDVPVVLTFQWGVEDDEFSYMLLSELQRSDIEFRFPLGNHNLYRFGRDRCMSGSEPYHLQVVYGGRFSLISPDDTVLADVDSMSPDDAERLAELDVQFGDALRDGTVRLDRAAAARYNLTIHERVEQVMKRAGLSATGLAESISRLAKWGAVETDTSMVEDFLVWIDLEKTARASRLAFVLTPNELPLASVCR